MRLTVDCAPSSVPMRQRVTWRPQDLPLGASVAALFEPSVMGSLFQDSAGTQPVTAVGQPVGRMIDRFGGGNHAVQSLAARRPTFARHPASGARNLLIHSNRFDQSAWSSGFTRTPNAGVAPDGSNTATQVTSNGAGQVIQHFLAPSVSSCTFSIYVKAGNATPPSSSFLIRNLTTATICAWVALDWSTMAISVSSGSGSITAVGNGWHRLRVTATSGFTSGHTLTVYAGSSSAAGLVYWLWGAQAEAGTVATALQTVTTAADITEAGQAPVYHLLFDGIDDQLQTASMGFGTAPGVTLVAAARTQTGGLIVEAGPNAATTNGGFALLHGEGSANDLSFVARTTTEREMVSTAPVPASQRPFTFVASARAAANLSPRTALRVNGADASLRQGTLQPAAFAANALSIGARADGSKPMNGRLYGLAVLGSVLTDAQRNRIGRYFQQTIEGATP